MPHIAEAAPGLGWRTANEAARGRPHQAGQHATGLIGRNISFDNKKFCIEDIAPGLEPPHDMGVWAYDTARWPSATEHLDERCVFLGVQLWQQLRLEAQQAAVEAVARPADSGAPERYKQLPNKAAEPSTDPKGSAASLYIDRISLGTLGEPRPAGARVIRIDRGTVLGNAFPIELAGQAANPRVRVVEAAGLLYDERGATIKAVAAKCGLGVHDTFKLSGAESRMWVAIQHEAWLLVQNPSSATHLECVESCRCRVCHGRPLRWAIAHCAAEIAIKAAGAPPQRQTVPPMFSAPSSSGRGGPVIVYPHKTSGAKRPRPTQPAQQQGHNSEPPPVHTSYKGPET